MLTQVTFRHLKSRPDLQDAAEETARKFEKFYDGIISANVEFVNDNDSVVDIQVQVNGNTLFAKESSDNFNKSLNNAADKIVRQLKKQKTKMSKPVNL